ncbi:helix-turn-helix domain-containing protein [Lactococcus lactis]|uniref:helix-turn-helix domain-containing protein n=1 Tax=Lactococcus lactis TaxID=1358 RepID=UPI0019120FC3|nr:helix-turn-helix transcriptional regulator [Lactococcus lactis]WDA67434.1 helix-turn-helix transcriptional regulator [Lactococcus lactis]WDA67495.1 helix-turn-helix transcriptional regulator [Lactococcus lactis]
MKLSDRIHELRLEKGYTLKDLANRVGIAYQTIQKYEKGLSKPRVAQLEKLAIIFDVSVSYLLGETDVRSTSKLNEPDIFPKRIKTLRLKAGLTQKQLATKLGISRGSYGKYGTDAIYPRTDRLQKLAEVFNVPVSYLLGEIDELPYENSLPASFPERLKSLRVEGGYSQVYIVEQLQLSSRQVYNKYERGVSKPSHETLNKLAKFFNVPVEYLLCETNERTSLNK